VALAVRCGSYGFLGGSLQRCGRADWQVWRKRIGVHRADTCSCLLCGATHLLCPAKQHSNVTYLMTVYLVHSSCGAVGEKYEMSGKAWWSPTSACIFSDGTAPVLPGFDSCFYTVCIFPLKRTEGAMGPTQASPSEAGHSFSTSVGVRNKWRYIATAPFAHMTYTGTRLLGYFRFLSLSG
jgi:hypothetical protein